MKKTSTLLWGSISILIGAVIAVLALVRGKWQLPLLISCFALWGLWLKYEDAEEPLKEISLFLQWLQRTGIGEQRGRAGFTIRENACDAMFSSLYTKYLLAAKRLMSITREQFIREHETLENALIDLKLVVADPFGYWVALDQEEPVPFAWFLRKAEVDVPYYIGTVLCSYA